MSSKPLIMMIARQRSGTHAVRAVLESHQKIHGFGEVFNPDDHEVVRASNYFHYATEHFTGKHLHPRYQEEMFWEFVEHLHGLHDKEMTLIDVKYNSCHLINTPWKRLSGPPSLLQFAQSRKATILHLTRVNFLRFWVSNLLATNQKTWHTRKGDRANDERISFTSEECGKLAKAFEILRGEDAVVREGYRGYDRVIELEYGSIFPQLAAPISNQALIRLSQSLEISNDFNTDTWCVKSRRQPLAELVSNWDEVCDSLRGTEFEYCIHDEPMFQGNGRKKVA